MRFMLCFFGGFVRFDLVGTAAAWGLCKYTCYMQELLRLHGELSKAGGIPDDR